VRGIFLTLLTLLGISQASANTYFGLNGSWTGFTSSETDKYKLSPKGIGYGGILGVGKDFVGLEAFYQTFNAEGDIKHEGEKGKINMNAQAYGAALRFSFQSFFLRLGAGRYMLDQSIDLATTANRAAAEDIYNIQDSGTAKNGMLFGIGVHGKFAIGRMYLDYTRHQIASVGGYDTISLGLVWPFPESIFTTLSK